MGRQSKPWYREDRDTWVATVRGVRHTLARGRRNRREAVVALARLIAHPEAEVAPAAQPAASIGSLAAGYLEEHRARVAAGTLSRKTFEQMTLALPPFAEKFGDRPAAALTPELVSGWLAAHDRWGKTTRAFRAQQLRALARWAVRRGLLDRDPLAGLVCGSIGRRSLDATDADARRWLNAIRSPEFRDYAEFCWLTLARRGEVSSLRAEQIDWGAGVAVLREHKSQRFGHDRRIVLTAAAQVVARKWAMKYPDGPIFRNARGTTWTPGVERYHVGLACRASGVHMTLHRLRHLGATSLLSSGEPVAVVSGLLGHASPVVTMTCYSHVIDRLDVLREAAERRRG